MNRKIWWLALLCGVALALPVAAQDAGKDEIPAQTPAPEAPEAADAKETPPPPPAAASKKSDLTEPMHRWGAWTISLAAWSPSAVGSEQQVAIKFPTNGGAYPIMLGAESNLRESWIVAYHLPKYLGSIVMHYDSMNTNDQATYATPGEFLFNESLAYPEFSGAFDDGFADGVDSQIVRKTRETRLEFSSTAWETAHTRATWGAGIHSVDYSQQLQVTYYALVPNLPPLIPPGFPPEVDPASLAPLADYVNQQSDFSGSGVGGSLDVEFRLAPRFSIISGLSIGLLRGKVSTAYKSNTSFYFTSEGGGHYVSHDELVDILTNGTETEIKALSQRPASDSLDVQDVSQAAQTFDLYVGIQSAVWRGLKVFATYREMYYQNVGAKNVPVPGPAIATESFSIGYEGYLLGLSWRF
jgi:hypothetical protein